ncbi:MAG: hypothetical protein DRN91_09165, partial [Candidatus Alkanophagales archaeon]
MGESKIRSGVTSASILAIAYAALTMTPVIIFMSLSTGLVDPYRFIPVFVTLLLFTEIGRYTGRWITPQEAYIIYYMAEIVAFEATYYQGLLMGLYYRNAPYTKLFGLAEKIPLWVAPPLESWAAKVRTFIAPEWIMPLSITLISTIASILIDLGLSIIFSQLFIEVEKLPFPVAPIDSEAILTLTERKPEKIVVFSIAAIISFFYEFLVYGVPSVSEAVIGARVKFIEFPWIDLTKVVEMALPGAILGIATDISTFTVGWLIPFNAVVWLFIGSLSFFVIGNALALKFPHPYFERWQKEWTVGADIAWLWQRSMYNLWASPSIGLTLALGIYSAIISARTIVVTFRGLPRLRKAWRERGYLTFMHAYIMIIVGTLMGIALSTYLCPHLWFFWAISWSLLPIIQGLIGARSIAEIGLGVRIPYIKEAFLLTFTEPGDVIPWMVPAKIGSGAGMIVHRIKVATIVGAKPADYYKAYAITLPLMLIVSFIYWQAFWSIAPIPSTFYPWSSMQWPVSSLSFALWVSRSIEIFKPDAILGFFAVFLTIGLVTRKFNIPFSLYGFVAGAQLLPPFAINYLIGAIVGRVIERKIG